MKKEELNKSLALEILLDLVELLTYKELWELLHFDWPYLNLIVNNHANMWDKLARTLLELTYNEKTIKSKIFEKTITLKKV